MIRIVKRAIFLMALPWVAQFISACCNCEDEVIKGMYVLDSFEVMNLDNAGDYAQIASLGTVPKEAYGIRLNMNRRIVSNQKDTFKPGWVSSAYALTCDCWHKADLRPDVWISELRIITNISFDSTHPPDSDISEYFKVYEPYSFISVDRLLLSSGSGNEHLNIHYVQDLYDSKDLLLLTPPAQSGAYIFKVQLVLSDGTLLEQTLPEVELI